MKNTSFSRRSIGSAVAALTMLGLLGASPASADTLDNIKDRGKIVIGIQGDNPAVRLPRFNRPERWLRR